MSITLFHLNRQLLFQALTRTNPLAIAYEHLILVVFPYSSIIFSQQKATSSTVTPQVENYRTKATEWVSENENKYKRPISPHLQIYR